MEKKLIEGIDYCEERHIICDDCFEILSENKDKNNHDHEGTEYKILNYLIDKFTWKRLLPKPFCKKGSFVF